MVEISKMKAKEAVEKPLRTADLQTPADVEQWLARLDRDRPARAQIVEHIVDQVAGFVERTATATPLVVELCPGAGVLTQALLTRLPTLRLIAIDGSEPLIAYSQTRLAPFAQRARWLHADLNQDEWLDQLDGRPHAFVSMQSLHDVGGEASIRRLYGLGRERLVAGGLFLNADLVVEEGKASVSNRLTAAHHLSLLQQCGFEGVERSLRLADFACCLGFAPPMEAE